MFDRIAPRYELVNRGMNLGLDAGWRGGRAVFLEVSEPPNPVLPRLHALYFRRVVPLIGGLLSDRGAYRYLPRSTEYLPSPEELLALLADAGCSRCRRIVLGAGAAQLLMGTRR